MRSNPDEAPVGRILAFALEVFECGGVQCPKRANIDLGNAENCDKRDFSREGPKNLAFIS